MHRFGKKTVNTYEDYTAVADKGREENLLGCVAVY